jgi:hypothetical protein
LYTNVPTQRNKAWEIFPFPCIGEFWFLEFGLSQHPRFQDIIRLLQQPPSLAYSLPSTQLSSSFDSVVSQILSDPPARRLLDLGTCIGQDLRALRLAGAPTSTLYGSDVFPEFEAVGHSLFLDAGTFADRFFTADVFDDSVTAPLNATAGMWDVVTMTMFLHQFDRTQQQAIAARAVRLLKHERGAMIIGNNTGQTDEGEIELKPPFIVAGEERVLWRQSRESMRDFWEKAVEEFEKSTGGKGESWREQWEIWCEYDQIQIEAREKERQEKGDVRFFKGGQQRRILFCVKRIADP